MQIDGRLNFISFFLLTVLTFQANVVTACKCEGEISTEDAVKNSEIVFKGVVLSRTITAAFYEYGIVAKGDSTALKLLGKNPIAVYKIKVGSVFKGRQKFDTVVILTPVNSAGCGVSFTIGQEWIVYADTKDDVLSSQSIQRFTNKEGVYFTNLCTRTTQWYREEENAIRHYVR